MAKPAAWLILSLCAVLTLAAIVLWRSRWSIPRARRSTHMRREAAGKPPTVTVFQRPEPAALSADPATWITTDDYPPQSIRNEEQGASRISWTIDAEGRPVSCRTVASSGYPRLDAAPAPRSCTARHIRPARCSRLHRTVRWARPPSDLGWTHARAIPMSRLSMKLLLLLSALLSALTGVGASAHAPQAAPAFARAARCRHRPAIARWWLPGHWSSR